MLARKETTLMTFSSPCIRSLHRISFAQHEPSQAYAFPFRYHSANKRTVRRRLKKQKPTIVKRLSLSRRNMS